MIHRGAKTVHKQLIKQEYKDISESEVTRVLKGCKKCKMYNPIKTKPSRIVEAYTPGEKVGFDIIELERVAIFLWL